MTPGRAASRPPWFTVTTVEQPGWNSRTLGPERPALTVPSQHIARHDWVIQTAPLPQSRNDIMQGPPRPTSVLFVTLSLSLTMERPLIVLQ